MISFLRGTVFSKSPSTLCLDVGGVGYSLNMSHDALAKLPAAGEEAFVLCRMIFSDSGAVLYGFSSEDERSLFDSLITVGGIGPKIALAALSSFSARDLKAAIVAQDIKLLSRIPGVGKKSASRIVLELKDKFPDDDIALSSVLAPALTSQATSGVREALESMGFSGSEIQDALKGVDEELPESAMLQYALKRLAR